MYKNFIFDLYGTLVDIHTNENTPYFWKKCAALLTEYGCPYEAGELKHQYGLYIEVEKALLSGSCLYPEIDLGHVFEKLFSAKNFHPAPTFLPFFASAFRVLSRKYLRLYPEILPILDLLKKNGRHIYLLSNAQALFTIPEIRQLGLAPYFDDILISSDCHCKKPDSAFMKQLLSKHSLSVFDSIMVGNEYESDVAVADAVHMDSYYIHTNLSPALTGGEKASYMDVKTGYLLEKEFRKIM